ncbi:DNA topoisomerase 3-alpha-like [Zophobas morio]|uniref:DNA topoisomerase 3-alpha-like n=1 Tax=Zophobas morio TaxID=2755281 RepID=UPI003082A661
MMSVCATIDTKAAVKCVAQGKSSKQEVVLLFVVLKRLFPLLIFRYTSKLTVAYVYLVLASWPLHPFFFLQAVELDKALSIYFGAANDDSHFYAAVPFQDCSNNFSTGSQEKLAKEVTSGTYFANHLKADLRGSNETPAPQKTIYQTPAAFSLQTISPATPSPSSGVPLCDCQLPAFKRTTQKDGPNQGRTFYACSKRAGDSTRCNFFSWTDIDTTVAQSSFQEQHCQCNPQQKAILRTVAKTGPNKGRSFYTCGKSGRLSCRYFAWQDEIEEVKTAGALDGSRHEGALQNGQKICYSCQQPGHYATTCPSRASKPSQRYLGKGRRQKSSRQCSLCHQSGHTRNSCFLSKKSYHGSPKESTRN